METIAAPELATEVDGSAVNVRRALTVGGLGAAALAYGATRANAAEKDVLTLLGQIEAGAIAGFTAAAGLPFIKAIKNDTVQAFLTKSLAQHTEAHKALIAAGATDGQPSAAVISALSLDKVPTDAPGVITLAINLEAAIIATASKSSTKDVSASTRTLFSQLAASAGQRQAILRAVGALVTAGHLELVALDGKVVASLPAAAGSVGFPASYAPTTAAISGV